MQGKGERTVGPGVCVQRAVRAPALSQGCPQCAVVRSQTGRLQAPACAFS